MIEQVYFVLVLYISYSLANGNMKFSSSCVLSSTRFKYAFLVRVFGMVRVFSLVFFVRIVKRDKGNGSKMKCYSRPRAK